ncbi:MAG: DUF3800 domain-containing protein [Pseudomonadota bacterium]
MTNQNTPASPRHLYIFLDEGGNMDFSPSGTKYFSLTSVIKLRPFLIAPELDNLKFDLIELGLDIECFHAAEDKQPVRDRVFGVIRRHLPNLRIDNLIVEKSKTGPALQDTLEFYPKMLGYLLRHPLKNHSLTGIDEVVVITDNIPIQKKKKAVEKAIKMTLRKMLPDTIRYRVMHHASKSNFGLQVADYCNWAIYRKWESGDARSYDLIKTQIMSEFDILRTGTTHYYKK